MSQSLASPVHFREWFRIILRNWAQYLSPAETMIVLFVLDRTMGWGKEWEVITCQQMQDGIYHQREDGTMMEVTGGIGLSSDRAQVLVRQLVERGVLLQKEGPYRSRKFAINYEWSPMALKLPKATVAPKVSGLKTPKLKPAICRIRPGNMPDSIRQYAALREGIEEGEDEEKEKAVRNGRSKQELESLLRNASERTKSKQAAKHATALTSRALAVKPLLTLWMKAREACPSYSPDGVSTIRQKDGVILQACMRRHVASGHPVAFGVLLDWSLQNWPSIMQGYFRWMADAPTMPEIRFFVRFIDKMILAYSRKDDLSKLAAMTTREQMVYHLVKKKGVAPEVAEREVDERLGLQKIKDEIQAERQKLQRLHQNSAAYAEAQQRLSFMEKTKQQEESRAITGTGGTFETWA